MAVTSPRELTNDEVQRQWREAGVRPLWEIAQSHRPDAPPDPPGHWPWRVMEPLVDLAVHLTSPAVAERRVLSMIDPTARPDDFHSITNLNAALQILLPGEVARPHRHSPDALRFILQGGGAVTRVDGKEAPMEYGDLVLTPGWCWHEHWHAGHERMVWLDVLNVHTHINMGTFSFEPGPVHDVPAHFDDTAFATANIVPDVAVTAASPIYRYAFADAKRALDASPLARDGSRRVRYVNPLTGGPVMPLLDCYLVRLEPGTPTLPATTSAHAVCAVVEGAGTTTSGTSTIAWEPRDVFTLPARAAVTHHSDAGAYLFVCSDREILRRLDLLTEVFETNAD